MNVPKINSNNQNNPNFDGYAIVRKYSYHQKKMKEIAAQLNTMKFMRNSEANVYIYSRYGDVVDIGAQKGAYIAEKAYKTKVETVLHPDAIVNAAKRSLEKYERQNPKSKPRVKSDETIFDRFESAIKRFFGIETK